jgi:hypothetical protein
VNEALPIGYRRKRAGPLARYKTRSPQGGSDAAGPITVRLSASRATSSGVLSECDSERAPAGLMTPAGYRAVSPVSEPDLTGSLSSSGPELGLAEKSVKSFREPNLINLSLISRALTRLGAAQGPALPTKPAQP